MTIYDKQIIGDLASQLHDFGFRVFLAEKGTYGFYTNKEGSRVVSFESDLGNVSFGGNYRPLNLHEGRLVGTGWRMENVSHDKAGFVGALNRNAPVWATQGIKVKYETLDDHLKLYGRSSNYTELTK